MRREHASARRRTDWCEDWRVRGEKPSVRPPRTVPKAPASGEFVRADFVFLPPPRSRRGGGAQKQLADGIRRPGTTGDISADRRRSPPASRHAHLSGKKSAAILSPCLYFAPFRPCQTYLSTLESRVRPVYSKRLARGHRDGVPLRLRPVGQGQEQANHEQGRVGGHHRRQGTACSPRSLAPPSAWRGPA